MKITFILFLILVFSGCNVAEIAGIAETELGDNFAGRKVNVDANIINFWRLDGSSGSTRIDSYGTADLSESGGPVLGESGAVDGGAANCNGATLENPVYGYSFDPAINDYTFSFWAKFNAGTDGHVNTVIYFGSGLFAIAFTQSNGPQFGMQFTFAGNSVVFSTAVTTAEVGQWVHFTVVLESSSDATSKYVTLYKNGTIFETQTNGFSGGGGSGVYICTDSTPTQPFNGSLDNIGIWERALTGDEISALAIGETNVD